MIHHVVLSTTSGTCLLAVALPSASTLQYESLIDTVIATQSFLSSSMFCFNLDNLCFTVFFSHDCFCCISSDHSSHRPLIYTLAQFFTLSLLHLFASDIQDIIQDDNSCHEANLSTYSVQQELDSPEIHVVSGVECPSSSSSLSSELNSLYFNDLISEFVFRITLPLIKNPHLWEMVAKLSGFMNIFHAPHSDLASLFPHPDFFPHSLPISLFMEQLFSYSNSTVLSPDSLSVFIIPQSSSTPFACIPLSLDQGLGIRRILSQHGRSAHLESGFVLIKSNDLTNDFPVLANQIEEAELFITRLATLLSTFNSVNSVQSLVKILLSLKLLVLHSIDPSLLSHSLVRPPPPTKEIGFSRKVLPVSCTPPLPPSKPPIDRRPTPRITPCEVEMEVATPIEDAKFRRKVPKIRGIATVKKEENAEGSARRRLLFSNTASGNSLVRKKKMLLKKRPIFDLIKSLSLNEGSVESVVESSRHNVSKSRVLFK
ncbi:hypothetical protein P9112_012157 [Eukaryota sp. TZLM1-RC]